MNEHGDKQWRESRWEQWLESRWQASPPTALMDEIMDRVTELDHQRQGVWWLRLIYQIDRSRAARWCVCAGALIIGGLPFAFLAHLTKFITF